MEVADALNDLAWEYEGMGDYETALLFTNRVWLSPKKS